MKRPVSEDENEGDLSAPKKPKMSIEHFNLSEDIGVSDESENDLLYTDLKNSMDKMNIEFADESLTLYPALSEESEDDDDSESSVDSYSSTRNTSYESDNSSVLDDDVCPYCHQRCHAALGYYSDNYEDVYDDSSEDYSSKDDFDV